MFKLVIQDDEGKTTVVPLIRDEITIGRKEGNTIRLTERNVSRRHARILRSNGEVQIEDLGSYNGIRVNNARIAERVSLRVSDQVQIGDYKLYLKAEGVEQVDDARTMPIERVTDGAAATEAMAAVAAPTTPVPVGTATATATGSNPPPAAAATATATATATAPLVGNPARTLVAMDSSALHNLASARPIADAALVAKLTETASYGRLVVVSSNFAGKEFELSRPQMIVGRTNENDIVIDHRSISRNHARMVREPDTGRYTISDLQSSNGVRVNGTDYGKVELRRGDVIDLGHVRLRFIEPGEDFVFARDAEISDVAEPGTKRGLLVAVVLGVVLFGGIAAYFAFHTPPGNEPTEPPGTASGTNVVVADSSAPVAVVVDAQDDVVAPATDAVPVAIGPGSGSAATAHLPNGGEGHDAAEIAKRCAAARTASNWQELAQCAAQLSAYDSASSNRYAQQAQMEMKASIAFAQLQTAVQNDDLDAAFLKLRAIPPGSSQRGTAEDLYGKARDKAVNAARASITAAIENHNCELAVRIKAKQAGDVQRQLGAVVCTSTVAPPQGNGSGGTAANPCSSSNVEQLRAKAKDAFGANNYNSAQLDYETVYNCAQDTSSLQLVVMSACHAGHAEKAKAYYTKLPADRKNALRGACMQSGIDPGQ